MRDEMTNDATVPEPKVIEAEKYPEKRKRVLLVDGRFERREVRCEMMRRIGIEVDGASDIHEANIFWQPNMYDLVLLHVENEQAGRDTFCNHMRAASPAQRVSFLVGKPEYLADLPNDAEVMEVMPEEIASPSAVELSSENHLETWGISEACRQISAVRSKATARVRALHGLPLPPRDLESSTSRVKKPLVRKSNKELTVETATKWIFG